MQGGRALVPPLAEVLGYGRHVAQDPKTPAGTSIPLDTVIGTGAASTEPVPDASPAAAPPPEPEPQDASPEVAETQPEVDVYGAPFTARSYGGEVVWAECEAYVSKVMRIRASEVVVISTKNRSAMVVMLTGGRAVLEIEADGDMQMQELEPAAPVEIAEDTRYRLVAMTDVELFTIFAPDRTED